MSSFKYHSPIFFQTLFVFMFCIMFGTRYQKFSWCWKRSFMLSYFQDHYVEVSKVDEWHDFYVVLNILQKINTMLILRQWLEFVLAVREMSGKRDFFLPTPWQPCKSHPGALSHRSSLEHDFGFPSVSPLDSHGDIYTPCGRRMLWEVQHYTWYVAFFMMTSSNGKISALLAICAGNSPVPGEFPSQRPVTRGFDVFFDVRLN